MQDHSESFVSKDRSIQEHNTRVPSPSTLGPNRTTPRPAAAQRSAIAAAQARLRTLDLNGLRDAYRTVSAPPGTTSGSVEAQAALQLDRTLIRQEIRRRGISLYDLFSAAELGVKE